MLTNRSLVSVGPTHENTRRTHSATGRSSCRGLSVGRGALAVPPHSILLPTTSDPRLAAMHLASHILAGILSSELMLGGQARLPFSPTPSLQTKAMSKANGVKEALPFVPLDAVSLTRLFGCLMCLASILVAVPVTRVYGTTLSGLISIIGWYSQAKMGVPYWLPIVNTVLAAVIWAISI